VSRCCAPLDEMDKGHPTVKESLVPSVNVSTPAWPITKAHPLRHSTLLSRQVQLMCPNNNDSPGLEPLPLYPTIIRNKTIPSTVLTSQVHSLCLHNRDSPQGPTHSHIMLRQEATIWNNKVDIPRLLPPTLLRRCTPYGTTSRMTRAFCLLDQ
jgi:hypothetical protein